MEEVIESEEQYVKDLEHICKASVLNKTFSYLLGGQCK